MVGGSLAGKALGAGMCPPLSMQVVFLELLTSRGGENPSHTCWGVLSVPPTPPRKCSEECLSFGPPCFSSVGEVLRVSPWLAPPMFGVLHGQEVPWPCCSLKL